MNKQINVYINDHGDIATDFSGFIGADCLEEAQRLQAELARKGVHLDLTNFQLKPELEEEPELAEVFRQQSTTPYS